MKFGVYTVCMPEYDIEASIRLLAELGYDGIEFRVGKPAEETPEGLATHDPSHKEYPSRYWGLNKSTLDVGNLLEETLRAKEICDEVGLEIYGLSGYTPADNTEELGATFEAANAVGASFIRVSREAYNPDARDRTYRTYSEAFDRLKEQLKTVEAMAREYNVKAVIELHHDSLVPSASAARRALEGLDPEHIGVIFDPGNMVFEGYERYLNGLDLLGDYVAHVHVKNAALEPGERDANGAMQYLRTQKPFPDGAVNFTGLFEDLRQFGYDGTVCVEDFSNESPTREKLEANLAFLKKL